MVTDWEALTEIDCNEIRLGFGEFPGVIAEAAGCSAEHVSGGGRLTLDLFLLAVCGLSPGCFVTPEDLANDHRFGC